MSELQIVWEVGILMMFLSAVIGALIYQEPERFGLVGFLVGQIKSLIKGGVK